MVRGRAPNRDCRINDNAFRPPPQRKLSTRRPVSMKLAKDAPANAESRTSRRRRKALKRLCRRGWGHGSSRSLATNDGCRGKTKNRAGDRVGSPRLGAAGGTPSISLDGNGLADRRAARAARAEHGLASGAASLTRQPQIGQQAAAATASRIGKADRERGHGLNRRCWLGHSQRCRHKLHGRSRCRLGKGLCRRSGEAYCGRRCWSRCRRASASDRAHT